MLYFGEFGNGERDGERGREGWLINAAYSCL